jgi:hypothetical protein
MIAVAGDKAPLSDGQLSSITAGSDFGASSAVVANSSSATIRKTGTITLQDSAQSGVKALNVFNSTGGAIGSGINVWDGKLTTDADHFTVTQQNNISSAFAGGAHVSGYSRDPNVTLNDVSLGVNYTNTELGLNLEYAREAQRVDTSYTSDRTFDLSAASAFSHDESKVVNASNNTAFDLTAAAQYARSSTTHASATQNQSANVDAGFGYSNLQSLDLGYLRGSRSSAAVNYRNAGDPSASGSATANTSSATGLGVDYDGLVQAFGGVDASYSNQGAFAYDQANGTTAAGNLAVGYTNDRSFGLNHKEATRASKSLDISATDSSKFNQSAAAEAQQLVADLNYARTEFGLDLTIGSLTFDGAMAIDAADAEYIVADNSTLDVTESYGVALGGNAQSNISAMNVVNAVGSVVGLGTNVARTPVCSDGLTFSQINTIALK